MPLNAGLEKVRGVKVVRIWSPMVKAMWYCPFTSLATTKRLNQELYCCLLKTSLPKA